MKQTVATAGLLAALAVLLTCCLVACDTKSGTRSTQSDTSASGLRVVTLAPSLAELMFAARAGDQLVAVSAYTDYPEAAANLPIISDSFVVDEERLALLKPDIVLAWESGTPAHVVEKLRAAGYRVEIIATQGVDDVATALEVIGALTGNVAAAHEAASHYRQKIQALEDRYAGGEPIRVFYQIMNRPLYTVNGTHYVSELIELCGGQNVFADIGDLAPMIDVEAVIDRNPEVMLAGEDSRQGRGFDGWDRWPGIAANQYGNRFFLPAAELGRATPRLVAAGESICKALVQSRNNRHAYLQQHHAE